MFKSLRNSVLVGALLAGCATAQGQTTYTYTGGTTGTWTTTTSFSPNGTPGAADTLDFTGTTNQTLALSGATTAANQAINQINVTNTGTTLIEGGKAGETLTIGNGTAGAGGITESAGAGAVTIGAGSNTSATAVNVVLNNSQTWTNNSSNTQTIANTLNLQGNTLTLTGTSTGQNTFSQVISGAGNIVIGTLGVASSQATNLQTANLFTGGVTLDSGIVDIDNGSAFGTGPLTLNGGTVEVETAETITNSIILGNNATVTFNGNTHSMYFSAAPITLSGAGTTDSIYGTNYSNFDLGTVTGAGNLDLYGGEAIGDGTSSANGLTGSLTIENNTVAVYGTYANATSLNATGSSNLELIQNAGVVNNFAINVTGTGATFEGDDASGVVTYNGLISGTGNFHQIGAGTSVLANAETYTGSTYATGGTLQIGNGTSGSIASTSATSDASTGTLAFDEATGSTITNAISNPGTVAGVEGSGITNTLSGVISSTGKVSQTGAGTTILTAANTYTGATTASAGTLQIGNGTTGSVAAASALSTTGTGTLAFDEATGTTVASNIADGGTVGGAEGAGITNTLSGVISGAGGFTQSGPGKTILTGSNTYMGPTTASAGTVQIGNGTSGSVSSSSALSTTGTGSMAFDEANGTTVANNIADNGTAVVGAEGSGITNTLSGAISGVGGFTQSGAGTTFLTGSNSYSGGTSVNAGKVYVNGGTSGASSGAGTGPITVATGATLGGSGVIRPAANGITLSANSTLISGGVQSGTTAGKGLTLDNSGSVANSTILDASIGSANLTFSLGAGNVSSTPAYNFAAPNTNSTYMTVVGNTANELKFATGDTITVNDLTGTNNLQLNMSVPYLLISAGSDADYSGLITTGGVSVGGVTQNGFVTNLTVNGTAATENYGTRLYLYNGDLEVVPEPSTWAMMIGGLAVLVFWQRRKNSKV
jgi:fibronectin-binding autotransporter adhesin